jgi:hypothetical protein
MNDEGAEIFVPKATVVEVDAEDIARIILVECHTTVTRAVKAANLILDHLIAVHRNATRKQ